jgi:hypothetical protein
MAIIRSFLVSSSVCHGAFPDRGQAYANWGFGRYRELLIFRGAGSTFLGSADAAPPVSSLGKARVRGIPTKDRILVKFSDNPFRMSRRARRKLETCREDHRSSQATWGDCSTWRYGFITSIARANMPAACANLRRDGGLLAAVYSEARKRRVE